MTGTTDARSQDTPVNLLGLLEIVDLADHALAELPEARLIVYSWIVAGWRPDAGAGVREGTLR